MGSKTSILSAKQIKLVDAATIEAEGITSDALMQRAGGVCVDWLTERYASDKQFIVIAGVGNNGGDALVISRSLLAKGYDVKTFVARFSEKFSADFQLNLDRLSKSGHEVQYVLEEAQFPGIPSDAVIIDGMFGSGLSRVVDGFCGQWIEQLNSSLAEVIAIDVPSGMFSDRHTPDQAPVLEASHTLVFQAPKLAFMLPPIGAIAGKVHVLDIGLNASAISDQQSSYFIINSVSRYAHAFHRGKFDHKGSFGHSLVIAGSYGMIGAAALAVKAAVKSGSGRVTAYVPKCGYEVMQSIVPEAMCSVDDYYEYISEAPKLEGYNAIGVGPGLGSQKKTRRMLKNLLAGFKKPVVIDADALNMLSEIGKLQDWLPVGSILTPHPGEFDRLFGQSSNAFKRLELLKNRAAELKVYILLKGAHSALATPEGNVYFNPTGNPGMATGGSGDVLTGLITGFLAQSQDPFISAICGMYVHGLAGDLAVEKLGQQALSASDIIDSIGAANMQAFSPKS